MVWFAPTASTESLPCLACKRCNNCSWSGYHYWQPADAVRTPLKHATIPSCCSVITYWHTFISCRIDYCNSLLYRAADEFATFTFLSPVSNNPVWNCSTSKGGRCSRSLGTGMRFCRPYLSSYLTYCIATMALLTSCVISCDSDYVPKSYTGKQLTHS